MPLPSITEIEPRRERLGLSQGELANLAGVSRSSIWKIEEAYAKFREGVRPRYVPSYEDAKTILEALEKEEARHLSGKITKMVGELPHAPLVSISPKDKVRTAKEKMKGKYYSQLPVLRNNICVGRITEAIIVDAIEKAGSVEKAYSSSVQSVMGNPFPMVGEETRLATVLTLVKEEKAVLVSSKGTIRSIITAFDVML